MTSAVADLFHSEHALLVSIHRTGQPAKEQANTMIQYVLPTIIPALKDIVHQLVVGDYAGLEERGLIAPSWDGGLSTIAAKIARVIEGYAPP